MSSVWTTTSPATARAVSVWNVGELARAMNHRAHASIKAPIAV
jgi:hypothetical protein